MEVVGKGGVLWLCKAFRHFEEDTWKIGTWTQLREEGLDGLQAFIGADILDSLGRPATGFTHTGLFTYQEPEKLREIYDKIRTVGKIEDTRAAQGTYSYLKPVEQWGSLKSKTIKKPDGWGGFITVHQPCEPKEYAAKLKEIFEGDPKNVK
jgi:hypothetical protein